MLTKADKLKADRGGDVDRRRPSAAIARRPAAFPRVIATSAESGAGLADLRAEIAAPLSHDRAAAGYDAEHGGRQPDEPGWATAKTLAEALPYIQIYDREIVVIKYGGHAMGEEAVAKLFAADAVLLKLLGVHPVVVHGGGPQISRMLERAGVKSTFVDGLAGHRRADHGGGRDGPLRGHQQGDRQLDHPGRAPRPTCAASGCRARTPA